MEILKLNIAKIALPAEYNELKAKKITLSKGGLISLNPTVTKSFGLQEGDQIAFVRATHGSWYIVRKEDGFTIRIVNDAAKINSKSLVEEMMEDLSPKKTTYTYSVKEVPTDMGPALFIMSNNKA